jgi:hypothetical protein
MPLQYLINIHIDLKSREISGQIYGLNALAKHNAAVTPRKPKNGADVGQVS